MHYAFAALLEEPAAKGCYICKQVWEAFDEDEKHRHRSFSAGLCSNTYLSSLRYAMEFIHYPSSSELDFDFYVWRWQLGGSHTPHKLVFEFDYFGRKSVNFLVVRTGGLLLWKICPHPRATDRDGRYQSWR